MGFGTSYFQKGAEFSFPRSVLLACSQVFSATQTTGTVLCALLPCLSLGVALEEMGLVYQDTREDDTIIPLGF